MVRHVDFRLLAKSSATVKVAGSDKVTLRDASHSGQFLFYRAGCGGAPPGNPVRQGVSVETVPTSRCARADAKRENRRSRRNCDFLSTVSSRGRRCHDYLFEQFLDGSTSGGNTSLTVEHSATCGEEVKAVEQRMRTLLLGVKGDLNAQLVTHITRKFKQTRPDACLFAISTIVDKKMERRK